VDGRAQAGTREVHVVHVEAGCPLATLAREGDRWTGDGVTVVRDGGRLHAFAEQCPHGGASLADAEVKRGVVTCPRHGARFRLSDGTALAGPTRTPLPCFDVEDTGQGVVLLRRARQPRRSLRDWLTAWGVRTATQRR
jgi:3-phenylpropionate/trans-cinnamate dioxygenase ferredoxin subunit